MYKVILCSHLAKCHKTDRRVRHSSEMEYCSMAKSEQHISIRRQNQRQKQAATEHGLGVLDM